MVRTIQDVRRDNLLKLLEKYRSIADFNEAIGKARINPTISMIKNESGIDNGRPRRMGKQLAQEIEEKLNLPAGWMDEEHDEPVHQKSAHSTLKNSAPYIGGTPKLIPIPTIVLQGGEGKMEEIAVFLDPELFERNFPGREISEFRAAIVLDNSMSPKFNPDDRVLIDAAVTSFSTAGVYCLDTPAGKVLRYVHRRLDGKHIVKALNETDEMVMESVETITFIGKVRMRWGAEVLPP